MGMPYSRASHMKRGTAGCAVIFRRPAAGLPSPSANARTGSTFPRRDRDLHAARSPARPRPDLLRDDMDCAESRAERAGRGASTRGPRARHKRARDKNDTHEERIHETQSQAVLDRGGNRPRRLAGGGAGAVERPDRGRHRQRRHRRRGHRRERAGGRRLGDRGDHRPSHPLRQDGGDRRPGPLRAARPSEGQIQGVGAWLRSRRFAQGRRRTGPAAQSARRAGAERGGGGAVLSRDLLVLDAQDPRQERVRRQEQHSREAHAGRLAQADEEHRLHRLPSARAAVDPHHPRGVRRVQVG